MTEIPLPGDVHVHIVIQHKFVKNIQCIHYSKIGEWQRLKKILASFL